MGKINKSQFIKKALQFLLPISFLVISYSSWLSSLLPFFNLYLSTLRFQLFNYNIDRIYMILLFNGILVFLVNDSGLIGPSQLDNDLHAEIYNRNQYSSRSAYEFSEMKAVVLDKELMVGSIQSPQNSIAEDEDKENEFVLEEENRVLILEDQGEEDREKGSLVLITEAGEEGNELSTEELNKKFEDFIKKMKEDIRIEAQQH